MRIEKRTASEGLVLRAGVDNDDVPFGTSVMGRTAAGKQTGIWMRQPRPCCQDRPLIPTISDVAATPSATSLLSCQRDPQYYYHDPHCFFSLVRSYLLS